MMRVKSLDPINLYMKDIARHSLLTAADEIELSLQVQQGDDAARQRMINANLRLVVKIARRYKNRNLPLEDMIEEGNIGLIRAVEKFDSVHQCRFSTYATWWIRQAVERGIMNQSRTIRLPVHVSKEINQMTRSSNHLRSILGREPTDNEIAIKMGKTKKRVQQLMEAVLPTESADKLLQDSGDFTVYDITEDVGAPKPSDQLNGHICKSLLQGWMSHLNQKEQAVVALRYGLSGRDDPWTLEAIGEHLGVTRERIRQIQVAALKKLRTLPDAQTMHLEEIL
ncbi:MAG: sigma-70 family RNA polymerase sigma factor [Ghiorsea sp.]